MSIESRYRMKLNNLSKKGETIVCIHPAFEERGRVKDDNENVITISLKDCLACSGCAISEDEVNLLSVQNPDSVLTELDQHPGFSVLISSSVLANYAASKRIPIAHAFSSISSFFTNHGASSVFHDGIWQIIWRNLILNYIKTNITNGTLKKPIIISRCPGSVMYFERKTEFGDYLIPIKPFPQLFAIHAKYFRGQNYVVNIGPCFDRKLETGRFPGDVDATLTINELFQKIPPSENESLPLQSNFIFPSCSDVEWLISRLGSSHQNSIQNDLIQSNSNQIQWEKPTIEIQGTSSRKNKQIFTLGQWKGAFICGETAIRNFVQEMKRKTCQYDIVEANLCPLGCASGGGLIRGTNPQHRKELVELTEKIHKEIEEPLEHDDSSQEIKDILDDLLKSEIQPLLETKYQSKEKENVLDLSF